jgi:hypothetical protein
MRTAHHRRFLILSVVEYFDHSTFLSHVWQNWRATLAIVRPETSSHGIARAFACSRPGGAPRGANQVDRQSPPMSAI